MLSHTLKEYSRNNDSYQADPKAIDFSCTPGMSKRECLSKAFQSPSKPVNGLLLLLLLLLHVVVGQLGVWGSAV